MYPLRLFPRRLIRSPLEHSKEAFPTDNTSFHQAIRMSPGVAVLALVASAAVLASAQPPGGVCMCVSACVYVDANARGECFVFDGHMMCRLCNEVGAGLEEDIPHG